jgi:hypothetical protein
LSAALTTDVNWISSIVDAHDEENPPVDWSGYMAAKARDKGDFEKATNYVFGPLIDYPPSHPDTMLTSLNFMEKVVKQHKQKYIFVAVDMQLYKVALKIKWSQPVRWKHLIVRPGGMHVLMSFIGSIGKLMQGSGLEELLNAAFKGVSNMLSGKAWPKALRAIRMVVTSLLEDQPADNFSSPQAFENMLEALREQPTGRLWIDCLIVPCIILHLYIRAERERNWHLHLYCLKRMICYFFSAGHWHYARYILWHVLEMETLLPTDAQYMFTSGNHVCRHKSGAWNAVFSDQFGEQAYMRYGKAKGGLVGMTLSPDQIAGWVLSYPVCHALSLAMESMFHDENSSSEPDARSEKHKEEGKSRRKLDFDDRQLIREELKKFTHPLKYEDDKLVNIYNGCVASEKVNVHNAVAIGESKAAKFKDQLPIGFHNTIHSEVVTMQIMKRGVKVGGKTVYDLEKLYGRLLILTQKRKMSLKDVFSYELAPLPAALYDEYGALRK